MAKRWLIFCAEEVQSSLNVNLQTYIVGVSDKVDRDGTDIVAGANKLRTLSRLAILSETPNVYSHMQVFGCTWGPLCTFAVTDCRSSFTVPLL